MTEQTIEGEVVDVVRTTAMAPSPRVADITDQTEQGLQLFEERVRVAKQQLKIALRLTTNSQWMVMDGGNGKRSMYATAGAADRILRMGFGMRWGKKTVTVDDREDCIMVTCEAPLLRHDGEVYETFIGIRRAEKDPSRAGGIKGYLKNEADLIKGSIANLKHRAVTTLLGLTFLSPEDFKELGLDMDKLERRVEFQDHTDNGKSDVPDDVAKVPFGKNKGKPVTELADKSLEWYLNAARESVDDPAKERYRENNLRWLRACEAEWKARGHESVAVEEEQQTFDGGWQE